ncbi:MAG: DNA repair protein RecO [Bacteroidetes bacterium]|nr:DNA repair protein RecO [Bacteroidota bacterium]MCH8523442.1 DNA repair protein RecO [Balneolales bacterium]
MIVSTAAIVLKSIDYQESSKIATILTPDHGKMGVMIRGCRKPKSKFSGLFEAGTVLDIVVYVKQSRTVQNVSEASYRQKNWNLRQDFTKLGMVMATMEMLDQLVHGNESSSDFFIFSERLLDWLNQSQDDVSALFPYIQLRLADLSGIGVNYDTSLSIDHIGDVYFNIEEGLVSAQAGFGLSFKLTTDQYKYLSLALSGKNSSILRNPIVKSELKLLIHHLDVYFKHHIDGLYERRSDAIFDQLL